MLLSKTRKTPNTIPLHEHSRVILQSPAPSMLKFISLLQMLWMPSLLLSLHHLSPTWWNGSSIAGGQVLIFCQFMKQMQFWQPQYWFVNQQLITTEKIYNNSHKYDCSITFTLVLSYCRANGVSW
jgi:hypothetical protein